MDEKSLNKKLSGLSLGSLRFFETIGSTNDEALAWATRGAPHLSLVIADEQTAGRGRQNRSWLTPKGSALAFSLILHPVDQVHVSRTIGLAALAITDACRALGLTPHIKWPNDILLDGKKVAGILIENVWSGDNVDSLVIGMGINVCASSVPPPEQLRFPATSLEEQLNTQVDREELLRTIVSSFLERLLQIGSDTFIHAWEEQLAYRGKRVQVRNGEGSPLQGILLGLESDGGLRLQGEDGGVTTTHIGDLTLRPLT